MNKKKLRYLPVAIYTLLPAVLWVYSIAANIVSLLASDKSRLTDQPSIDIRWFLSASTESISSLPWGEIILILMCASMIKTCGLPAAIRRVCSRQMSSKRTQSAFVSAGITLFLAIALLLAATIYPWNLLYSITGQFEGSPLGEGWAIVLFTMTAATTIVFGIVSGAYRNTEEIIKGISQLTATHAHSLISLIPAALFIGMSNHLGYQLFSHPIAEYTFLLMPFLCDIYTASNNQTI